MVSDPNEAIQKSAVEVRQGTSRPKMIYVLAASVVLVLIVFGAIAFFQR